MGGRIEMSLTDSVIQQIKERKLRLEKGEVNSIPSPFQRFSNDFIGIEQSTYYLITSFTKGGKSQFTSYIFIFKALLWAYYSKSNTKLTILYFPLEETKERIMQRFMSFLLCEFTNGEYVISPSQLRSSKNDSPCPKEVIDLLENDEIQDILRYFESNVIFFNEDNPTGIYKVCRQYAEDNGKVHYKKGKYRDELGQIQETDVFDYYEPNNPNEYKLIVIDTINIINTERGLTLKQSIDKLSEYLSKYLRNRYGFSPVVIQQQNTDSENNEAVKMGRVRPTIAGLADSKYTARDCNVALGLFSPFRFGLKEYLGYDITKFKDSIRFLEVLVNRDSTMGGIVALHFNGAVSHFNELPLPNDEKELRRVYESLKPKEKSKLFLIISKFIK